MRTAGVFLIFAAVALRGAVLFSDDPNFGAVIGLLAAYGLLLIFNSSLRALVAKQSPPGVRRLLRREDRPPRNDIYSGCS